MQYNNKNKKTFWVSTRNRVGDNKWHVNKWYKYPEERKKVQDGTINASK